MEDKALLGFLLIEMIAMRDKLETFISATRENLQKETLTNVEKEQYHLDKEV